MQQIGKFQLRKILGKGASGTVYLALDTFSGNDVALKVLDPEFVKSPDFDRANIDQFMNEASLAGKLSHPHIASILEASVTEDSGYIALEYVPGGDLSQYTSPESLLSQEDAIQIAFKACSALDYAFRRGIVHRDIKPANILVVSGTNIKVADFGAAYLATSNRAQVANIGSPFYMSPEQAKNEPLDYRSDMFSLGVVLYQLFTGTRPFQASTLEELLEKVVGETPQPPSAVRPGLGREIDTFIMKMIAKTPGRRYATWADLALRLAKMGRAGKQQADVPDSEKFFALEKVHLLHNLDDAEIWELAHVGTWSRVPTGTVIVKEGDEGMSLFFIGSGQAKVIKQDRLLNVLDAGECVGEMAYIKQAGFTRQATVETMSEVLLVEFGRDALEKVSLRCRYQLSLALMHSLVDRLSLADERLVRAG